MQALLIIQIVLAVLLTGLVLMQSNTSGIGASFGSGSYHTKRGLEKGVFYFTAIIAVLFTLVSIVVLI